MQNKLINIHLLDMNVKNLGLSNRSTKALLKTDIKSLRELIASEINNIKGLGHISKNEIADFLSLITKSITTPSDLPDYIINVSDEQNIIDYIYDLSKAILSLENDERLIKIIELRFGLNRNKIYSFEELAEAFDLKSGERIRQLKKSAIELIHKVLSGKSVFLLLKLPPKIIVEAQELFSLIKESGAVLTENKIIRVIEDHYTTKYDPSKLNELRYILTLFRFEKLPNYLFGQSINVDETWITTDKIDKSLLINSVSKVRDSLRQLIITTSMFDLKINVNKGQKEKINSSYIEYSLGICKEIEKVNSDEFQIKFEYLSNIADKAYRILYENKTPMHINDILKEINHRLIKSNNNPDVLIQNLRGEIIADKRFDVVGKSSIYFLTDWGNIVNSSISELIEECLHLANKGSSFSDIYNYVKEKRPNAEKKSVYTILRIDQKFIKVGKNIYELAEWGNKPFVEDRVIRINEVSRIIKKYFVEGGKNVEMIKVLKSVVEKEFNMPISTFYKIVRRLPFIQLEKKENTKPLIAHYLENVVPLEKINAKQLQREAVVKRIFEFLNNTNDKVLLIDLRKYTISKTDVKKPTFYKILSEIEEISKEKIETQIYCRLNANINQLSLIENEHIAQIEIMKDQDVKKELINIFKLLNPDTIDVAFFRLGKVFENELRKYLIRLKETGHSITSNNLSSLSNMIEYVTNKKSIAKMHHLTILREKRNECAHEILSKIEKDRLLKHAPFYIELFIKYIIYFSAL